MAPARFPNGLELRAAPAVRSAGGRRLEGVAAPFGTPAAVGAFTETIRAGAFTRTLATPGRDVLALVDHDPSRLLARTGSGSLRLAESDKGLIYSLDLPPTTLGSDILALAERGDLGGVSIGFRVLDEVWPARDRRELRAVELVEISIVQAFPCYTETTVSARARQLGRTVAAAQLRAALAGVLL